MDAHLLFIFSAILYLAGAVSALFSSPKTRWGTYLFAIGASLTGLVSSLLVLVNNSPIFVDIPIVQSLKELTPALSLFSNMGLQVDALSAFFVLLISLLVLPVSIYAIGYVREYEGKKSHELFGALYNLFPLSMLLVVTANNALLFLICWELMTLVTYFLVTFDHEKSENVRAGSLYFIMAHVGTAFLIALFALFYQHAGSLDFDAFRQVAGSWAELPKTLLFIFALVGFGMKAGIVPLHIWLPQAHPAAPTPISALMSGIMIKTAIYGLLRIYFDLLRPDMEWWWGVVILSLATISAVIGILFALIERDLKRILAYSSVENIGIILIGVGLAMIFYAYPSPVKFESLASFALIAALFHLANHAVFKGLLFMGAGAVFQATHTRNIEQLGGLIRWMPWTAACFLVGAVAISALPPLNGFVSEWLTFQSLILGLAVPDLVVKVALPVCAALLALTGALVAACFVRAFGITFLARPRSEKVEHAREVPLSMRLGMAVLALLALVMGLAAAGIVPVLSTIASSLVNSPDIETAVVNGTILSPPAANHGTVSPLGFAWAFLFLLPIAIWFMLIRSPFQKRIAPTWACGLSTLSPRMEYTATGFSKPIRMIFRSLIQPRKEIIEETDESSYIKRRVRVRLDVPSPFDRSFYSPLSAFILKSSRSIRKIQSGSINAYLAYIFLALIVLLIFAR
jgi:hydrogenase-4 component B